MVPLAIRVDGAVMNGLIYVPAGQGPHPAVIMFHGLPGFERNLDLAQSYRRAGWAAMTFHYRGAWGSSGSYSFEHVLEDCAAAMALLRSGELADRCSIDPERVVSLGHSLGGWAALMVASENPVLGAVSIAGWNVGAAGALVRDDPKQMAALVAEFEPGMLPLGGIDARWLFETAAEGAEAFDVCARAPALGSTPLLLAIAADDDVSPKSLHHQPLVDSLRAAGCGQVTEVTFDTDHAFSDKRLELARTTESWLTELVR